MIVLLCLAFAITSGFAGGPETWVPARWQGGPLELQRRAENKTLPDDPFLRETIDQWYDPSTLTLLQETPINCLLVTWSAGGDPQTERQQQKLVKIYALQARKLGVAVLGLVYPGSPPESFVQPAIESGLDGLVLERVPPGGERFVAEVQQALRTKSSKAVVVSLAAQEQLAPPLDAPVLAASDAVVPSLRESGEGVEATPSSEPWIDSNIWLVRSLRSWGGSRPVWLGEHLAANAAPEDYLRAIADAAAGGGRWIVSLTDELQRGLHQKQPESLATWRRIAAYLKFQQEHAAWDRYPSLAAYEFIQDSSGKNRIMSGENLNLVCRQRIPLRLIERDQFSGTALEGVPAVHAIDLIQPTEQERKILSTFAEKGGLVVVGPSWKPVEVPKDQDFALLSLGKGRVAVYRDEWPDAGSLSRDLIDLLGRDNLGVRLFRVTSVLSHISAPKDGSRILVQLLNYASYPADSVLVRVAGDFRTARFYTPESAPVELALEKSNGRVEVTIPQLSIYGGVLLEK